jgi:hypothetical protein
MIERKSYSSARSAGALPAVVLNGTSSRKLIATTPINEITAAMLKVTAKACVRSGMIVARVSTLGLGPVSGESRYEGKKRSFRPTQASYLFAKVIDRMS